MEQQEQPACPVWQAPELIELGDVSAATRFYLSGTHADGSYTS